MTCEFIVVANSTQNYPFIPSSIISEFSNQSAQKLDRSVYLYLKTYI